MLWGFKFGIDFAGGSLWEIRFVERALSPQELSDALQEYSLGELRMQEGEHGTFVLRFREVTEAEHQALLQALAAKGGSVEELRFEAVGPTVGKTLKRKAVQGLLVAIVGISVYIAWAFRKVSRPIASWKYGVATVFTLFHDVLVPLGLFSYLGEFRGVEIDANFVVALLVVMGFSVHDTIVVFDRIRENLKKVQGDFASVVNKSVNETMARSINTSLTTLLALLALWIFGAASLQYFVLAMMVGIFTGIYSSIFIASPLLVSWEGWHRKKG